MLKLLWRTDVHMSDQPPQSRVDCWSDTILEKLKQVGDIAKRENVSYVLDGGDFFHQKSPSKTSHQTILKIAKVHKEYPCPVYSCVGNHDCVYGDLEYLPQQPLGVLFETGVFRRLYDNHVLEHRDDEGFSVKVVGVPYHGVQYDLERFLSLRKESHDFLVVVAHVLSSPQGGSMFEGEDIIPYSFFDKTEADLILLGHWHKDQGIQKTKSGKVIVNIGSLSRGSLSQDNLERKPGVALITFKKEGFSVERPFFQVKPVEEVFSLEKKLKQEVDQLVAGNFISSLQEMLRGAEGTSISEIIRNEDLPETVREKAILYWEVYGD